MPKYDVTLPEVIASHVGPLPQKSQKEGVWEGYADAKVRSRGCGSEAGLEGANDA